MLPNKTLGPRMKGGMPFVASGADTLVPGARPPAGAVLPPAAARRPGACQLALTPRPAACGRGRACAAPLLAPPWHRTHCLAPARQSTLRGVGMAEHCW